MAFDLDNDELEATRKLPCNQKKYKFEKNKRRMIMRNTKTYKVREHLINKGSITSWEAIELYRATRLSSIIHNLRKEGYIIENEWCESVDSDGNKSRYVKYNLLTPEEYFEKNSNHIPRID